MGNARSAFGYPQNVLRRFSADTPHRTVRAVFPHTALRVGLVSSVSLPFAPRLRFTLIPMDAPPYGRAVSDAPPHSGLSPIAVFRHYCSRHLICIVPFTRRGPSHPRALPRFPATTASSDSSLRFRYTQFSRVPLLNFPNMRPSYAPPRPRSPNRIGHEVLTSHIETCWSRGFRVNETLRRKFTCVAAYFFVRQDSRTSVADYASLRLCRPTASIRLCTACPPNRMSISLRFSSFQLIVHAELRLAYLHH